jgi:type IV pilus assembly protein PilV
LIVSVESELMLSLKQYRSIEMKFKHTGRYVSPRRQLQQGLSMLEVLISILLLAVGAIGAAGMQLAALKDSGSADSRYRAASIASGMVDTLRANRNLVIDGSIVFESELAAGSCTGTEATPIRKFLNQIACELPGGQGSVAINKFTKRAIVTVQWDDTRASTSGSPTQQFQIEARL